MTLLRVREHNDETYYQSLVTTKVVDLVSGWYWKNTKLVMRLRNIFTGRWYSVQVLKKGSTEPIPAEHKITTHQSLTIHTNIKALKFNLILSYNLRIFLSERLFINFIIDMRLV